MPDLLYGTLGRTPLQELFKELLVKNAAARQFGWGRAGAGGSYTILHNYVGYFPHREGSQGALATFPFDAQIHFGNDLPAQCAIEDVMRFAQENLFLPFWFFDWCKKYLAVLRAYQPRFDAAPEAKLVWITHVAWAINAALGATNVHGTLLPSAIYENVTGDSFYDYASEGQYMFFAQHAAALPDYWKREWTKAAQAVLNSTKDDVLLDSGYKVFDRKFNPEWESAWRGGIFPVPMETRRFRYDPPISWRERKFNETIGGMKGLAGAHYNDTIENDPYIFPNSLGQFKNDFGMAHILYQNWARFVPWAEMKAYGPTNHARGAAEDPTSESLLSATLALSTAFWGDDTFFWEKLAVWKRAEHSKPQLIRTAARSDLDVDLLKGAKLRIRPLYEPNYELAFRYFYPAMIDLVLACDFYTLVNTGINVWWKYNVNSGAGVGVSKATETTPTFDDAGKPLRDKNGILYGAPIVPTGTVQESYTMYQRAEEEQKGIAIAINLAQSFLAILQAIVGGNYGALVGAAKGWFDAFSQKFPKPEDSWRGVVPPTPPVQRQIPTFGFLGSRDDPQPIAPTVSGWYSTDGKPPLIGGGTTVLQMMYQVRGYMRALKRFGAPFEMTAEDRIDLEGIQNPVSTVVPNAPRSISFPDFPEPGFEPGSKEAIDTVNNASIPPRRSKGGLLILGFGLLSGMVGVLLARRSDLNLRPWRRHG